MLGGDLEVFLLSQVNELHFRVEKRHPDVAGKTKTAKRGKTG
jgi:hypothetical protein